jgi:hypothetical protein
MNFKGIGTKNTPLQKKSGATTMVHRSFSIP